MISKQKRIYTGKNKGLGYWNANYRPMVKVSQVEPECISFLTEDMKLGKCKLDRARLREYKNGSRFSSKPILMWSLTNREKLIYFLEKVMPYLKIKKTRALHLLDFSKNMQLKKYGWHSSIPENELVRREEAYQKMRQFNSGKVAATTKS